MFVVELGTTTSGPLARNLCSGNSGVFFSASNDAGATWDTAIPIDTGSISSEVVEPAIATSGANVFVAYTELRWADPGCSGTPDSATIFLTSSANNGNSWTTPRRASPLALTGLYRSPSVGVLPDLRVVLAFRDDTGATPQIETEVCDVAVLVPFCGSGTTQVGPATVVGEAPAPSFNVTNAAIACPLMSWTRPTTAASATAG